MSDAAQSPGIPPVQEIQDGTESEQLALALEPTSQNPVYPSTDQRDRFKASTIEEKRSYVRGEVRCFIPVVDLDSFVKFLLPPLQDGIDLKTAVSFLEREGLVTPSRRWKVFETPPAKGRGETERKMSEPLAGVYKSLIEHVSHHADIKPILTLSLPSTTPGESHDTKSMVTEGFRVTNKESKLQRYDIALTAVFRKRNFPEDREGNINDLLLNVQRTLALDASRRSSFGIKVEIVSMRLWPFSWATPVESEAFDFTSAVEQIVHVFLSIALALKGELGWDPTVRPIVEINVGRGYRIDVGNETFETEKVFSDSAGDALVSDATRVWIVRNTRSGVQCVPKDVWADYEKEPEHAVQEANLHDIGTCFGDAVRRETASHFLMPAAHSFVPIHDSPGRTTAVVMRAFIPSTRCRVTFRVRQSKISTSDEDVERSTSGDPEVNLMARGFGSPFPNRLFPRKILNRENYRVVFKEVAQDLYSLRKLSNSFLVLRDTTKLLKRIHGSGWVHRDCSIGNLHLFEGRGLIGDFEFAKRKNTDLSHEHAVGTRDFMAAEALRRIYIFSEDAPDIEGGGTPPFAYNDLHDLESLWWIATWKVFFSHIIAKAEVGGIPHQEAASELFGSGSRPDFRMLFLKIKGFFWRRLTWISPKHSHFRTCLRDLRWLLVRGYNSFEAEFPAINLAVLGGTHDEFAELLETARVNATEVESSEGHASELCSLMNKSLIP